MDSIRKKKIETAIVKVLASLLVSGKVKDPRIGIVSVHRAEISPDLSQVKIWITSYCTNSEKRKLFNGMNSAKGYFQSVIAKELHLRNTPEIRFLWDTDYIKSLEVNQLIDKSMKESEVSIETSSVIPSDINPEEK